MSAAFLSMSIWPELTKAARGSRQPCAVAVAYFGEGASRLLPLVKGSRLVVDASERSVAAGLTCPTDLIRLVERGVAVYSVPNLHAKVFVLGRAAYVGSSNASNRSAGHLIEALIRTTERSVVRAASQFVRANCLRELTPESLKQLAKLYRPPQIPGGKKRNTTGAETSKQPTLPRVLLAQLEVAKLSDDEQRLHDAGLTIAEKRRTRSTSFELDSFIGAGRLSFRPGDVVIQLTQVRPGGVLVTAPGNVLHVRTRKRANRTVSCIYVERPTRRRRSFKAFAAKLGRGASNKLRKNGVVRDASFVHSLLDAWAN